VGSADRVRTVADLVRARRSRQVVVVVSALGGITDLLIRGARLSLARDAGWEAVAYEVLSRHHATIAALVGGRGQDPLLAHLDGLVTELRSLYTGVYNLEELTPRTLDAIAGIGERASCEIVAAALEAGGTPAVAVDARRVVVTDESFGRAQPLMDETGARVREQVLPILDKGAVPVVAGFIGATRKGVATTLGRGGSDFTASILGALLPAEEIQIWTDVDGMLTADPRIVDDAEVVRHLSFAEAAELAYFGAKVLHPSTIFPAVSRNIPVRILNSHRPEREGTLITADPPPAQSHRPFAALACKRGITILDITSTRMLMAHGFLRRVFEAFEVNATAVDVVTTSEVSVSVTIDDNRRGPHIVAALLEIADVTVEEQMAILTVVGDRLTTNSALAARIVGALTGFPLRMVSQAASRRNVTIVLPEAHLAPAMRHLHRELFAAAEPAR